MSYPPLPAFRTLLKSREVEDPVNLWLHRPAAYAFVALFYRTPLTPNQITVLSMVAGVLASLCWVRGTAQMMIIGGVLMWTSAVLDGADGMLARAKKLSSDMGRILDGTADMVVVVAGLIAASVHLWEQHHSVLQLALIPVAWLTGAMHVYMYDYYKESYMMMTRPDWDGKPERLAEVRARIGTLKAAGRHFDAWAVRNYLGIAEGQAKLVALCNPLGARDQYTFRVSQESTANYRRHNRGPMRLWALISLAPHMFLFSIFGAVDRIDAYLWLRVVGFNVLFVIASIWQRQATRRTRLRLEELGLSPVAA